MLVSPNLRHYAIAHYLEDKRVITLPGKDTKLVRSIEGVEVNYLNQKELLMNRLNYENTLFIWDDSSHLDIAKDLRAYLFNIVNAGEFAELEHNRVAELQAFEKAGLKVPSYTLAFSFDELLKAVEKFEYLIVKGEEMDVIWGPKDFVKAYLLLNREHYEEALSKYPAIVEEFIRGYEISCEVYFINGKFIPQLTNFTIETKYFLVGDLGIQTGGENNLVFPWFDRKILNEIVEETLKLSSLAERTNYTGIYDLNFIIRDKEKYVLEITPRIGYPGTITWAHILLNSMKIPYDRIFISPPDDFPTGFGFGVLISLPPYPMKADEIEKETKRVFWRDFRYLPFDFEDENDEGIYFAYDGLISREVLEETLQDIQVSLPDENQDVNAVLTERGKITQIISSDFSPESECKYFTGDYSLGVLNSFSLDIDTAISSAVKRVYQFREKMPIQARLPDEKLLERINFFLFKE